jgi:hypothetical protein
MVLYKLQFMILESSQAWRSVLNGRLSGLIQAVVLVDYLQLTELQIIIYSHDSPTCFDS